MPANGRRDLIRRLKVNVVTVRVYCRNVSKFCVATPAEGRPLLPNCGSCLVTCSKAGRLMVVYVAVIITVSYFVYFLVLGITNSALAIRNHILP